MPPRGRRALKDKQEPQPAKSAAQAKKPTKTRGRKKMDDSEKTTTTKKRKQMARDVGEKSEETVPPPKRQKKPAATTAATNAEPIEETDRAVDPKEKEKPVKVAKNIKSIKNIKTSAVVESGTATVTHPSHRNIPGQVMVFGQGDVGQLGLGDDTVERKKPFPVGGDLEGKKIVQVVCGGMHTVALSDDGKVYSWGCNDEGALGHKTEEDGEYIPGLVEKLGQIKILQVSAGDSHTAALASDGTVYCWGVFRDSNGPFGLSKPGLTCSTPEPLYSSNSNKGVKIASGSDHVVILTEQGEIYSFGCAEQGQLGRVPECFSSRGGRKGVQSLLEPQVVRFRKSKGAQKPKFTDIFCGSYHTFALAQDHSVYTWGLNNYGQLGAGHLENNFQPERLPSDWLKDDSENSKPASKYEHLMISGGQHHTIICHNGNVYACGRREYGRLGLGENSSEEPSSPVKVSGVSEVRSVSTGSVCSFAVSNSGDVFSWGMGTNLQLGTGEEEDMWSPTKITGKKIENRKIISVSAGGQHSALLVSLPQEQTE